MIQITGYAAHRSVGDRYWIDEPLVAHFFRPKKPQVIPRVLHVLQPCIHEKSRRCTRKATQSPAAPVALLTLAASWGVIRSSASI